MSKIPNITLALLNSQIGNHNPATYIETLQACFNFMAYLLFPTDGQRDCFSDR